MARTLLTIVVLLMLTGCPQEQTGITPEQIAAYQAELKQAEASRSFWQCTAGILTGLTILALIVGIVMGSKAKKDSDEP